AGAEGRGPGSREVAGGEIPGEGKGSALPRKGQILVHVPPGLVRTAWDHRTDHHTLQIIEVTRALQLGQQTVEPVDLLARVFPEENGASRVDGFRRARQGSQQGQTATHQNTLPHSGRDDVLGGEVMNLGSGPGAPLLPIDLSGLPHLPPHHRAIESDEVRAASKEGKERGEIRGAQVNLRISPRIRGRNAGKGAPRTVPASREEYGADF